MKNAVLRATHYGIDIYKHVLRLFYPENYQWKTDGSAVMVKNPYNENSPTLQIKIHPTVNSKIARHFDVAKPDFYGDCFDFAALYYKCGGDELLRKLNNELYLHIGDEYRDQEPVRFSFFRRPITSMQPYKNVTLKNVYEVIVGGYYKAITERLRAMTDKRQARDFKANHFDYCTFSGTFNSRRADALIQHSGLMCLDFDHIPDVEELKSRLLGDTMFKVPAQVVSINYGAFSGCPNLTTIVLPDTAATLKGWAVSDCGNLNRLIIPKAVTTIEDDAIRNCNNLTIYCEAESKPTGWATNWNRDSRPVVWSFSLDILDTTSNPDNFTFYTYTDGTAKVTGYNGTYSKIIIPSKFTKGGNEYTVTIIGDQAFRDNTTIVSVVIPNTVTDIESNAFRNCKNLESVEIPKSVTYIGLGPFCESNKLTEIKIDSNNKNFVAVDGVLYTADMRVLVQYPCNKADTKFTIPYGVETIEYGAFSNCPNLITLTIPRSTTEINWWAICGCSNLRELFIPNSVTEIEGDAIRYCKNLTIYCEAKYEPSGWDWDWNYDNCPVIWNTEMGSAVDESAATAVNIYAYGNTIVVENATEDVYVYNAMGGLVTRTTSATITINGTGVYIVKTGNVVKRVMIND